MNSSKLNSLVSRVVSKEVLDQNRTAFEYLDKYKKTISIFERTEAVLGKKVVYKSTSSSTINGKLNLNAIGTTH
jgi:hypothetical protein